MFRIYYVSAEDHVSKTFTPHLERAVNLLALEHDLVTRHGEDYDDIPHLKFYQKVG